MARTSRRKLLKLSGTAAVAAKTGGIAAILTLKRASAYAQATTLHRLRWNDFVPACDALLQKVIIPECPRPRCGAHRPNWRDTISAETA
jgi:multiple sugar transport system substrate-binding protein